MKRGGWLLGGQLVGGFVVEVAILLVFDVVRNFKKKIKINK